MWLFILSKRFQHHPTKKYNQDLAQNETRKIPLSTVSFVSFCVKIIIGLSKFAKIMIKAVIFDIDGVLVDNTSLAIQVFQEDARRCGVKIPTREEIAITLGLPWKEMVEILLGQDANCKKIHCEVWDEYEDKMELMSGAEEVLNEIHIKKAIVTSKPRKSAERELRGIFSWFEVAITEEDVENHKPNPEPLLTACEKLNIKPNEAVYIGDAINDLIAAKSAGVDFIGMLSGAVSESDFKKAGAKKTIHSLPELLGFIK